MKNNSSLDNTKKEELMAAKNLRLEDLAVTVLGLEQVNTASKA